MPPALLRLLVEAVLPPACAGCGLPGPAICDGCRAALLPLGPPACAGCGHPAPLPLARCPRCPAWLAASRQAVAYAGPAPALVTALKSGRPALAHPLAGIVAATVPPPTAGAVLVPVPLGRRRLAERGYNQSLLLARGLARHWGLAAQEGLVRLREDGDQRGASAGQRACRPRGAFAARGRAPAHAVLVDDVHTTGATLAACARALRAAGARRVDAVAVARSIDRRVDVLAPAGGGSMRSPDDGGGPVQLQVKGRNVAVTDALFAHAEGRLERLARILPPWDDAEVVELELSVERNPKIGRSQTAEVTVRTKGPVLRVRESADDMYHAIDQAAHKLERQARRYRERRTRHRRHGDGAEPVAADATAAGDPELGPRLVKTKRFDMKPMSAEEAALHMDMLHHSFYVFRNDADGAVNVVYRRDDGDYGLIEPEG